MPREFNTVAREQLDRQHGAFPAQVVKVEYKTGTKYYSDRVWEIRTNTPNLTLTTEARVIQWPESIKLTADPERAGGFGSGTFTLQDSDGKLLTEFSTQPGVQGALCEIALLWNVESSTGLIEPQLWENRTVLARGVLSAPTYNDATVAWDCQFQTLDKFYDKDLGFRLDQNQFADVRCMADEGKIIPIAFGNPVLRVPSVLIERPGFGHLVSELNLHDDWFELQMSGAAGAFDTSGATKTYYIGYPHNWEEITGSFQNPTLNPNRITVATRGHVVASGNSPGMAGIGGQQFILLPQSAFANAAATNYSGHMMSLQIAGVWVETMITMWQLSGANVIVAYAGSLVVAANTPFKVMRWPGFIPKWPAGTPVYEAGDWTYACNFLSSVAVDRVEAQATITPPGGGNPERTWFTANSSNYTVNLDNKTWNSQLGRGVADEGLTTVTIDKAPSILGFEDNTIYVTLQGPELIYGALSTIAVEFAPHVAEVLANRKWLGNVKAEHIDSTGINTANQWIAAQRPVRLAFAVVEQIRFAELLDKIGWNGTCAVFWDQGQLNVQEWPTITAPGDEVETITLGNTGEFPKLTYIAFDEIPTEATGEFKPYPIHEGLTYRRVSTDGRADLGERSKQMRFELLQKPTSVVRALNFWFAHYLHRHVKVDSTASVVKLLAMSIVDCGRVDWDHALDSIMDEKGIVTEHSYSFWSAAQGLVPKLDFTIESKKWDYTIDAVADPSDDLCRPAAGDVPSIDPSYGWPDTQGETPPIAGGGS